jgi:hypothetical protein
MSDRRYRDPGRVVAWRQLEHRVVDGRATLRGGRVVEVSPGVQLVVEAIPVFSSPEADRRWAAALGVLAGRPHFDAAFGRASFRLHVAWLRLAREIRQAWGWRELVFVLVWASAWLVLGAIVVEAIRP